MIAAIVVLDTLGAVALGGVETLSWLLIVGALFFFPAGLVIAELGATFPDQGGPYRWVRLAFGRRAGAFVALSYWGETTVWVGGSLAITAVAVVDHLIAPVTGTGRVVLALAFIWVATLLAAAPLRTGRRFPVIGAAVQVGLLAVFTTTVGLYAVRHGLQGLSAAEAVPSWAGALVVAPVLVYSFLGLELPSAAAGEMKDPQADVPAAIARAGTIVTILYSVPILAILLVVPASERTGLTGFIDAIDTVFTVYGPAAGVMQALAGIAFVWVLLTNAQTWLVGSTRAQAVASAAGDGPAVLGRIADRIGTPLRSTAISGIGATVTALAAFAVAGNDNDMYFVLVLSLAIAMLAMSNLLVFPSLVRLRTSHPNFARPYRVPGGAIGAWLASGLATGWVVLAVVAVLWPGLGTSSPDAHLPPGFAGNRLGFLMAQLVPLVLVGATAVLFVHAGQRRLRRTAALTTAEATVASP
ncbi:MAG: APC family permease [Acidimicrobiia bacterium]|nr:APC family permease [Acidimicrobiia bacterium]